MNNKAWSHLPNARHIDWVLQSLKDRPELWDAAWNAARNETCNAAWSAAWYAAWDAAQWAAWDAARDAACKAASAAKARVAVAQPRITVCSTLLALVAYDDCEEYLNMTYEQLHAWALLSETPQAVLLLPMKWVQEHECLVASA